MTLIEKKQKVLEHINNLSNHGVVCLEHDEIIDIDEYEVKGIVEQFRDLGYIYNLKGSHQSCFNKNSLEISTFINTGGFIAVEEEYKKTNEIKLEEKAQNKIIKDLDLELKELQIDSTKRSIRFYKYRYAWLFVFTILGSLLTLTVNYLSKDKTEVVTIEIKEQSQQKK